MATTSNTVMTTGESNSNVPQWKRDLIQRRRQQSKVLVSNGANVKLCSAVFGSASGTTSSSPNNETLGLGQEQYHSGTASGRPRSSSTDDGAVAATHVGPPASHKMVNKAGRVSSSSPSGGNSLATRGPSTGGAPADVNSTVTADLGPQVVACNMRLEVDLSLCSDSEDANALAKPAEVNRKTSSLEDNSRNELDEKRARSRSPSGNNKCSRTSRAVERDLLLQLAKVKSGRVDEEVCATRITNDAEDAESDSSEELQYGPGIVNKLKSKYLNLTLREMNKSRASVQRFRRAASLENLLDCEEEVDVPEKSIVRKYTKRNVGVAPKTDRYRNAARGNDSMKRARSVETLMRYNNSEDAAAAAAMAAAAPYGAMACIGSNGVRQEPVNDHIILIDRSSVKIENRLADLDRPKPINKPKRIKPVLAETERPPPDLVKTTMRIFEGSARKLKPKGEVAAKVATFKTINDTFKAQAQKKIIPKPPLQPKPFINGNSRLQSSPKKIVLPQKPTAELIEKQEGQEEYHMDGVITDPIVQSVSSVVSKFQQIEKSHSPSPSPEPSYKLKFSPAPSPEPSSNKLRSSLEINVKSPPVTPVLSPRISSPRVQSPASPKRDIVRQNSSPVQKTTTTLPSPSCDLLPRQISAPELSKVLPVPQERENSVSNSNSKFNSELPMLQEQQKPKVMAVEREEQKKEEEEEGEEEEKSQDTSDLEEEESVDGSSCSKTISKSALDNISKAGITMQFSFSDKPINKSYLPGLKTKQTSLDSQLNESNKLASNNSKSKSLSESESDDVTEPEVVSRLQERTIESEKERKNENSKEETGSGSGSGSSRSTSAGESKPIGAISSLGLMKSTTTTSYPPQGNESKIVKSQKTESPSPPQKQIGIIRPLVSTKAQHPQQNLSNRELEKNLINRVKSIEQPTKVVVSLKSAEEIQPMKKPGSGGGGLWDTKPWNQQNNTMVFNFSNRKDVPDYIENDGLFIRRKRDKPKVGDAGIIMLDATVDASTTDDADWEISGGPPSPCDVSFLNDNILINGRSNLSKQPRNHKHRIQFDDAATRMFEYPSETSMLEGENSSVDGETSGSAEQSPFSNKTLSTTASTGLPSLLGGGGLASYTPSKVDLTSDGFELGVTRAVPLASTSTPTTSGHPENSSETDYLKPAQDAGAWGSEPTGDLLY